MSCNDSVIGCRLIGSYGPKRWRGSLPDVKKVAASPEMTDGVAMPSCSKFRFLFADYTIKSRAFLACMIISPIALSSAIPIIISIYPVVFRYGLPAIGIADTFAGVIAFGFLMMYGEFFCLRIFGVAARWPGSNRLAAPRCAQVVDLRLLEAPGLLLGIFVSVHELIWLKLGFFR